MFERKDVERMIEGELERIAAAKEKLQTAREAEAIEASRKRLAKRAEEAGRKRTAGRKVKPAITSHTHRDGRVEILDPDHPELWSREARDIEAKWAEVDRGRRCSRGYIISAPCSEQVRIK